CHAQYDPSAKADRPQGLTQASLSVSAGGGFEGPVVAPQTASIANRKTLPYMGRALDLVGECNCEILKADPAFAVRGGQELVGSEPELAGPTPRGEQGGGREKRPVQGLFAAQQVEEGRAFLGFGL